MSFDVQVPGLSSHGQQCSNRNLHELDKPEQAVLARVATLGLMMMPLPLVENNNRRHKHMDQSAT